MGIGPVNLSANTHVIIEHGAAVMGVTKGDAWPLLVASIVWPQFGHGSDCKPGTEECRLMRQSLFFAWNTVNVSLTGQGTIDGQGKNWWACSKRLAAMPCNGYARPHLLMLANVTGAYMSGLTIQNSPCWTLHFSWVTDLHVVGVTVLNPKDGKNADGIDLDCVENALVEN